MVSTTNGLMTGMPAVGLEAINGRCWSAAVDTQLAEVISVHRARFLKDIHAWKAVVQDRPADGRVAYPAGRR